MANRQRGANWSNDEKKKKKKKKKKKLDYYKNLEFIMIANI